MTDLRATLLAGFALLLAPVTSQALSIDVGLNFQGTTVLDSGFYPPDSMGAVGSDHIVEFVNGRFAVYDATDGSLITSNSLDGFWAAAGVTPDDFAFDPRILYDPTTQRWFAASVDDQNTHNNFLVAVSDTSDPTGTWSGFSVPSESTDPAWADYPMLGMNESSVFVAANMFSFSDTFLERTNLLVIPKADLLLPSPTIANANVLEGIASGLVGVTVQPVVDLDGSASHGVLLSDLSLLGFAVRSDVLNPATAPTIDGPTLIPVLPSLFPGDAPQPGALQDIDVCCEDNRFQANVILLDGSIWAVNTVLIDGRQAIRWLEIDESTDIVLQSGVIADEELSYYLASIAVNEFDQVVIGFNGSSESQFVSSYAVAGSTAGGVTAFGEPLLLAEGTSSYEVIFGDRNRWGDYSATVVDPDDPFTFWTFQEIPIGTDLWAIQITQLHLVPEPGGVLVVALGCLWVVRRRRGPERDVS